MSENPKAAARSVSSGSATSSGSVGTGGLSHLTEPPPPATTATAASVSGFVSAGHAVLFQNDETDRCDVCAEALRNASADEDGDDGGFDIEGRGLLVWTRGEERRYQEPPLCASCATAIGVSALQRWEIEEEEG